MSQTKSKHPAFRVLTIDHWSRESVLPEVGFRLAGQTVVDALNRECSWTWLLLGLKVADATSTEVGYCMTVNRSVN